MNAPLALQGIHPLAMKQFTIAVLFLVSLVAQGGAAGNVLCGGQHPAAAGDCEKLIKDNRDRTDGAPRINSKFILTETGNHCAIFSNSAATRKELALQGQVILNSCNDNGSVSGQMNGPTTDPVCIVSKNRYVIFFFRL